VPFDQYRKELYLFALIGEVVEGMEIVSKIESVGSASGKPGKTIKIAKSGTI
jgi:peptidylprolyl isomerase